MTTDMTVKVENSPSGKKFEKSNFLSGIFATRQLNKRTAHRLCRPAAEFPKVVTRRWGANDEYDYPLESARSTGR
jgi:hypothetical protein